MSDLISRQAAIDVMAELQGMASTKAELKGISKAWKWIKKLPSVQPDIIHCKDCKHSEHWYRDKSRCFLWHEEGIDVFEDGFCNYAERRTDG